MLKRFIRGIGLLVIVVVFCAMGGGLWIYSQLRASLPTLDGEVEVVGIAEPVRVDRDDHGIPTLSAKSRTDLGFGLGYAHGQDRFFQMDVLRRSAAGELAELFGGGVLAMDKGNRLFRFRDYAKTFQETIPVDERALVEAYVAGVNAGLGSLGQKPFEYLVLGVDPAPWRSEDVVLVAMAMFIDLQGRDYQDEAAMAILHDTLPKPMYAFLHSAGNDWDAPIDGSKIEQPSIPGPEVFDLRAEATADASLPLSSLPPRAELEPFIAGSNNWAVAGTHSTHGGALVANDMHLRIGVPNIWYRARFVWPGADGAEQEITGATLPGTPVMVVGSNGHVAWGFTNSEGDWTDVIVVEVDPENPNQYLTPEGKKEFVKHQEKIQVRGGGEETVEVVETIWGPVFGKDVQQRPLVLHWVAKVPGGLNFGLDKIASARTLDEAMTLAAQSGSAEQNFVVGDKTGSIGWTILGRIPKRVGFDGRLPVSWADGTRRWDGWLDPEEYPRVVNPESGRIWTANARVVGGEMLEKVGVGGYDLGARAGQIRDGLMVVEKASEADLLKTQLDDRAVFHDRWQKLLLELLTPEAIAADPRRGELKEHVENWGARASVDSIGYPMVSEFRLEVIRQTLGAITQECQKASPAFSIRNLKRTEGPVWLLVTEKPMHLLHPKFKDWNEQLLAAVDVVLNESLKEGKTWSDCRWGVLNTTKIQHPLSIGAPWLGKLLSLDMPGRPLPGGPANLPRIQRPSSGASERLGVSPGKEELGYFHMATGQSGHPLSPHYSDGQKAWEDGEATPFLPGPTVHTLLLKPKSSPATARGERREKNVAGM